VVGAALDKKAEGTAVLSLTEVSTITDHFIICHGRSGRQVQAIADRIEEILKRGGHLPSHIEGYAAGEWILMDYGDFVVHVFTEERRRFYDLEKLWSDAPRLDVPPAPLPPGPDKAESGAPDRRTFF
jgi:ribosome-associated protein